MTNGRRLVSAVEFEPLLDAAARFVSEQAASGEVLLVAATRGAADDLVRMRCGSAAGVHRLTFTHLIAALTATPMAERGLAPLNRLGSEAMAARAVHRLLSAGKLRYFAPVAPSPGFARALERTLRELRLEQATPETVAATGPPGEDLAELLRVYEEVLAESRLADFPALLRLALPVLKQGAHRFDGLPLVLLDVAVDSSLVASCFAELALRAPRALAVVHSGDEGTREKLVESCCFREQILALPEANTLARLRRQLFMTSGVERGPRDEQFDFFSAAGEGLECTEIARRIHTLAGEGVRFDSMAILLRNPERYQPLVEEALNRAGVPFYFTRGSVRPDAAGRAFLALLACALENFTATRFAEYLSLGQTPPSEKQRVMAAGAAGFIGAEDDLLSREEFVAEGGEEEQETAAPATPAAWEKLIVDAAVVGGRERWQRRLRGLENELTLRLEKLAEEDEALRSHLERQIELLGNLERLALPVIARLDALPQSASWRDWLELLGGLAQMTLRRPGSVLLALNELWALSEVGPVTLEEVFLVLRERLRFLRRPPQKRRYGQVWIGTIDEARGQSFDIVFLPGLAEGMFPKKALEDPLLLDGARRRVGPALACRDDRVAEERLRLRIAAALARRKLVVSYPRMDVTQNRPRVPSFYAMEVVRAAEGWLPDLKEFERRAAAGALTRLGWPAPADARQAVDAQEFDLAKLHAALSGPLGQAHGAGRYLFSLNPHLKRAVTARHLRWEKKWSTADGLLHGGEQTRALLAGHGLRKRPWSASSLQHFAACPYRFLLNGIFRLKPRQESVALEEMDPLTRGSLFHTVLYRFFRRLAGGGNDLERLMDSALDEVAAKFEEDLAPAIPRVWKGEVEDVRADLRGWLRRWLDERASWELLHCEYAFGLPGEQGRDPASSPEHAQILDGVLLRGSIDWIERHLASGFLRVTDHKTGRTPKLRPRHIGRGVVLQPLLYALAAEQKLGQPVKFSRLYYCTHRGGYEPVSIAVSEEAKADLKEALGHIDRAVTNGLLPAAPDSGHCEYCDYRIVCGPREEERVRKRKPPLDFLVRLRNMP
ncbi:MAG: PD-(D/E)XK nuclease family protein [Acidobacteria bacterium]|nr:PD-(D/E)XK nuclease family protein [Acidobacteriota bacterium]